MLAMILAAAMEPELKTNTLIARSWNQALVVGHRGAAAYAPENTMAAFEKGIESGCVSVECDVWMSRDGVAMVMHDRTLDRTTALKGPVAEHDAAEMTAAGVPTLEQLIKSTKGRINLVVEIKGGQGVEKAVVDLLRRHEVVEESIVFSFGENIVRRVKELNPMQYCVWLSSRKFEGEALSELDARLAQISADAVGFPFGFVDKSLADHLRAGRKPLFVWTVPPGREIDRLKELKVNFIITNHPKDARRQLAGQNSVEFGAS